MMDRSGEVLAYFADLVADEKPMLVNTDTMQGRVSESTHLVYYWLNGDDLATRYDAFAEGLELLVSKAQAAGANYLWNTRPSSSSPTRTVRWRAPWAEPKTARATTCA